MKKYILIFIFEFIFLFAKADNCNIDNPLSLAIVERDEPSMVFSKATNLDNLTTNSQIDLLDTVVFDLSQAIITGTSIDIPISIISDDTINALDFSLKYDQVKFLYDSIIDLTTYLQAVSFYNNNDSTIRFTSNSFHQYATNTALVYVRFTILLGNSINAIDLNTIKGYLNGIKCSIKLINSPNAGLNNHNQKKNTLLLYPNPTKDQLNIIIDKKSEIDIIDISGKIIFHDDNLQPNSSNIINLNDFSKGIYLVRSRSKDFEIIQKIILE